MNKRARQPVLRRNARSSVFLFLSLLLHLVALLGIDDWRRGEREAERFRARLRQVVRFEPKRLTARKPSAAAAKTEMEFRPSESGREGPKAELPTLPWQPPPTVPEAPFALRTFDIAVRPDTFRAESVSESERAMAATLAFRDSARRESFDLMRVSDLARGHERAVVLIDPDSRRDVSGFVKLTRVRMRGAGGGNAGLEALARYLRDHTSLLVQVRPQPVEFFTDPNLMNDPVHFLIQGGGRGLIGDWPLLQISTEEKSFLEAYMRGGGLLYFEGGGRFLAEAVDLLRELLGADAGIMPIPGDHPLYHSFYSFPAGFPGEDKARWEYMDELPPSWHYPALTADPAPAQTATFGGSEDQEIEGRPAINGLWGVSLGDTLVAVVSDLLLHAGWVDSTSEDETVTMDSGPALVAGVNIIVHSITRTGTVAKRRALPAWVKLRPRTAVPDAQPVDPALAADGQVDPNLYDALGGSVAVVRSPLGQSFGPGGLRVRVDGRYTIDLLRGSLNGVVLHNLPAGPHWVEIEYQGSTEGVDVVLRGGQVATLTFGISRLAMLTRVRLRVQEEQVGPMAWRRTFSDLNFDEVFLEEDELPLPVLE